MNVALGLMMFLTSFFIGKILGAARAKQYLEFKKK